MSVQQPQNDAPRTIEDGIARAITAEDPEATSE